jgi:hypothetical protein
MVFRAKQQHCACCASSNRAWEFLRLLRIQQHSMVVPASWSFAGLLLEYWQHTTYDLT